MKLSHLPDVTGYILITVIKIIAVNADNGFTPRWQQQVLLLLKDKSGRLHRALYCFERRFKYFICSVQMKLYTSVGCL